MADFTDRVTPPQKTREQSENGANVILAVTALLILAILVLIAGFALGILP